MYTQSDYARSKATALSLLTALQAEAAHLRDVLNRASFIRGGKHSDPAWLDSLRRAMENLADSASEALRHASITPGPTEGDRHER